MSFRHVYLLIKPTRQKEEIVGSSENVTSNLKPGGNGVGIIKSLKYKTSSSGGARVIFESCYKKNRSILSFYKVVEVGKSRKFRIFSVNSIP